MIAEWKVARKLIDNVFTDLENMFYLLAELLLNIELNSIDNDDINGRDKCCIIMMNIFKILATPFVYLLVFVALFVILPSCIFLLIVRMNKAEVTSKNVAIRKYGKESKWQRYILNQLLRSSFMFSFLSFIQYLLFMSLYHMAVMIMIQ